MSGQKELFQYTYSLSKILLYKCLNLENRTHFQYIHSLSKILLYIIFKYLKIDITLDKMKEKTREVAVVSSLEDLKKLSILVDDARVVIGSFVRTFGRHYDERGRIGGWVEKTASASRYSHIGFSVLVMEWARIGSGVCLIGESVVTGMSSLSAHPPFLGKEPGIIIDNSWVGGESKIRAYLPGREVSVSGTMLSGQIHMNTLRGGIKIADSMLAGQLDLRGGIDVSGSSICGTGQIRSAELKGVNLFGKVRILAVSATNTHGIDKSAMAARR